MCHTGQTIGSPKFLGVGRADGAGVCSKMEQGSALPTVSASLAPWGARGHKREHTEQGKQREHKYGLGRAGGVMELKEQ